MPEKLRTLSIDDMYKNDIYIAFDSKNKNIICYSENEEYVKKYLTANDLIDKCDIFDSDNERFNRIFQNSYCMFELDYYFSGKDIICTNFEYNLYRESFSEYYRKMNDTMKNLKEFYNSMKLTEKEKNILFKATKLLYDKRYRMDAFIDDTLNNKDLRKMAEIELKISGADVQMNFEDVFGYYMIII